MFDNPIWMLWNGAADTQQMCEIVLYYNDIDQNNRITNGKPEGTLYPGIEDIIKSLLQATRIYMKDKFYTEYSAYINPIFSVRPLSSSQMNNAVNYLIQMLNDFLTGLSRYDPANYDKFLTYRERLLSA